MVPAERGREPAFELAVKGEHTDCADVKQVGVTQKKTLGGILGYRTVCWFEIIVEQASLDPLIKDTMLISGLPENLDMKLIFQE